MSKKARRHRLVDRKSRGVKSHSWLFLRAYTECYDTCIYSLSISKICKSFKKITKTKFLDLRTIRIIIGFLFLFCIVHIKKVSCKFSWINKKKQIPTFYSTHTVFEKLPTLSRVLLLHPPCAVVAESARDVTRDVTSHRESRDNKRHSISPSTTRTVSSRGDDFSLCYPILFYRISVLCHISVHLRNENVSR